MKTKITSFYLAALVCALTFATGAFADTESGFYEKEHIRGFVSLGGDFRGMRSQFEKYVNTTAFTGAEGYDSFDWWYIGLHLNIGAQYKQFLTWFDINFMPTQTSERPSSEVDGMPLYDVRWFTYGADWMFGYKLLGENFIINLIPAVGFGFNLINFHLASNLELGSGDDAGVTLRDRYYSTMASTFNSELELRLELGQFAIGIYGGYKVVRYNELEVEGTELTEYTKYDTDNVGDTWFVGLRLTWIFLSDWQSKVQNKL
ncbi:MAG: hypothetical protein MJY78_07890 [Fibrobacter sp.]|nr:hypothetical protein [Fibrobacter sp.]